MNQSSSKPYGWLNLYLTLLLLGGIPFIAFGLLLLLNNISLALIGIFGGIAISLCSLLSRRGFCRRDRSGLAYARIGDILFAMTTFFYTINLFFFELTPKSVALMTATMIWCALWLWYLSQSAQVKRLSGLQRNSSQKSVVLLGVMFVLFIGLTAWAYARMQAIHAKISINQMRERIRIEAATAEWEAAQAATEKAKSEKAKSEKAESEKAESEKAGSAKVEAAKVVIAKPNVQAEANPVVEYSGETVKNIFFSFKVPDGYFYYREEGGTKYLITDLDKVDITIEHVIVLAASHRLGSASIDFMRTYNAKERNFETFTQNGCKVDYYQIEGKEDGEKVYAIAATKISPDYKDAVLIKAVVSEGYMDIFKSVLNSISFD